MFNIIIPWKKNLRLSTIQDAVSCQSTWDFSFVQTIRIWILPQSFSAEPGKKFLPPRPPSPAPHPYQTVVNGKHIVPFFRHLVFLQDASSNCGLQGTQFGKEGMYWGGFYEAKLALLVIADPILCCLLTMYCSCKQHSELQNYNCK